MSGRQRWAEVYPLAGECKKILLWGWRSLRRAGREPERATPWGLIPRGSRCRGVEVEVVEGSRA